MKRVREINPSTLTPEPDDDTLPVDPEELKEEEPETFSGEGIVIPPQQDYLKAGYQVMAFLGFAFQQFPRKTPALAMLGSDTMKVIDEVAKGGVYVFDNGAKVTASLWNWQEARNFINDTITSWFMPEERKTFELLYTKWLNDFVIPMKEEGKTFNKESIMAWVQANQIPNPQEFVQACFERLKRDTQAEASNILDLLSRVRPTGTRRKTTTGVERVKLG